MRAVRPLTHGFIAREIIGVLKQAIDFRYLAGGRARERCVFPGQRAAGGGICRRESALATAGLDAVK
jgi:hypothetical protein